MIRFNLKLAVRNLAKNKVYSLLIIGGFAIGFAACILIALFYHTETTVNRGFPNHKQIYRLYDTKMNRCNLNWDLFPVLTSDYAAVEDACPLEYSSKWEMNVKNEQTHANAGVRHLLATTNNFFSIFSVDIVNSLSGKPLETKESVSISRDLAEKLFGTQNPLGQELNIHNYFFGKVSSVFKELPSNSTFQADIILNSENQKFRFSRTTVNGKRYNPTNHFILLKEGANPKIFADELNKSTTLKALDVKNLDLQKLDDIYLSKLKKMKSQHDKGNPTLLKIFLFIALLILLLSSINYLNYSISMQYAGLKKIGINKTHGAGWGDLLNYSFVEAGLGVMISVILAVIITMLSIPYSERLLGKALHVSWHDWLPVAPFFLAAVFVVILVNSFAPIYLMSKFRITEFLSGFKGTKNQKHLGKQVMLTFQLTASIVLIAIVIIIFRQLNFVKHSDLGFDQNLLVRIDIPYQFQKTAVMEQEIGKLPFVKSASTSIGCPGMINMRNGSNTGSKSFDINCIFVGDNYLKTMGIELADGRDFLPGDFNKACLLNQEALKQFEWDTYVGKTNNLGQENAYTVIGIVKDFKFQSFYQAVEPLALVYAGASERNVLSVRLAPGNTGQQIGEIKKVWKSLSPYEPLSFTFYDDFFQSMYAKEEKLASSITFFSLIAIALTCMGILGQIFMICLSQIKEIGIRKINGAQTSDVLIMLNRDIVKWVVAAFIAAAPLAWYAMNKWLQNFAYKIDLNWWNFVLAGVIALVIALLTVSWQSWKAATRNPVEALRYE